jgi:cyanophycinase-like exopeptidase
MAILGQYSFTAEGGDITSGEALKDPFGPKVKLTRGFFEMPFLDHVITETRFRQHDRMGRLIVFLARIQQYGWERTARAIAVDEKTALLVDDKGKSRVVGEGSAYFLRTVRRADVLEPSVPLSMRDGVDVYRIDKKGAFDLDGWDGSGGVKYFVKVERGSLLSTQPGGSIY